MKIAGYSYEADTHCTACTMHRFNVNFDSELDLVEDSEGNAVHPIFAIDLESREVCGDCWAPLDDAPRNLTYWDDDPTYASDPLPSWA